MDWDLIIGWMGDTGRGSSWGGRAKSSLSANVKFSVTIRLFALLGRCDSEFDVKRSVLSGASGRRSFERRLAFTCRSVRSNAAAISIRRGLQAITFQFWVNFWDFSPAQVLVEVELLLELEQLGVRVGRPQPARHPPLATNCK